MEIETRACECCSHPKLGYVEKEVLSGRQTIAWGAEQLGVAYQTFWTHLQNHVKTEEDVKTATSLADILDEMVQELYKRFKVIVKLPRDGSNEREVKSCVDSLNECIMNVARLKRIISTGPNIQIQTFNLQMSRLIEFVHEKLPPEVQDKIIEFLGALKVEETV